MPTSRVTVGARLAGFGALFAVAVSTGPIGCGEPGGPAFPPAAVDYFKDMDGRVRLTTAEIQGRNTWLIWTAGNDAFWDYLAGYGSGTFDFLKVLDSRNRFKRFSDYGLMNEPGFKQAGDPDEFGLWLDAPDGTEDPYYASQYKEAFPREDFIRTYGRASGVVGLRLFPNPDFDDAAKRNWNADKYYNDPEYYRRKELVRPYRVGMSCAFCHVGPHPLFPPADAENPKWENLSSNVGAQYWRAGRIFSYGERPDSFLFQLMNSMPPGTVDTSLLATDNINNPRAMNAIYNLGARIAVAQEETLSVANRNVQGTEQRIKVPHFLKDGADSIGVAGALSRVYISIGEFHVEWIKHFNLLIGGKKQTPIEIAVAQRKSPHWRATAERMNDLAAFLVKASAPHDLGKAPGGARFLDESDAVVTRGKQIFAENCAVCHSSKFPPSPQGNELFSKPWDEWTKTDDFKRKMTEYVLRPDFLDDNFLSTDQRYPVTRIGTNACSTLATNALRGHIWDNFSSDTYKDLPAVGTIEVHHPLTGAPAPYPMPDGGRGYQRAPSLVSLWTSAPYLHNNSVGKFIADPSVPARMEAFQDGIEKLLWPEKRLGMGSVYRTTEDSWLIFDKDYVPDALFKILRLKRVIGPDERELRLGPIPKGTPVNLLANIDLELSFDARHLSDLVELLFKLKAALGEIREQHLTGEAATARLKELVPILLKISKCQDFVTDRGHLFGTNLTDDDKRALIAFLKRL